MNGKTVRKMLMRNRASTFFGSRAYLTVRVPLSALGLTAPEPVTFDGMDLGCVSGMWMTPDESSFVSISSLTSGHDPREFAHEDWEEPRFLECDRYGWSWWEGWRGAKIDGAIVREALPDDVVARHRDYINWIAYLDHIDHPLMHRLMDVSSWCKTHYWEVRGDHLMLTYSVKWFYPNRRLGFAAALSRAIKAAKRMGIAVRVYGG